AQLRAARAAGRRGRRAAPIRRQPQLSYNRRMSFIRLVAVCACVAAIACGAESARPEPKPAPPDDRIKSLADTFLTAFFDRTPEAGTFYGVPGRHHDALTDNSIAALRAWEAKEDGFLRDVKAIDGNAASSRLLRATYAILRQSLEGNVAKRV